MSEEIVVRGAVLPLTEAAREKFAQSQVDLIAASKAKGADLPTLHAYLELASRYDLDPFANEIWCANMSSSNGGAGALAILVGRDGYLKVARRDIEFIACPGQAVYEKDHFTAEWVDDETGWRVEHKITNVVDRGEPLGAWARLLRKGKPTIFFFAPLEQFKKGGGAWKYEDAMIVKCAQSYVLRTTYGISGPTPYDEVSVGFDATASAVEEPADAGPPIPASIVVLLDRARSIDRRAWRENEVLARLDGTPLVEAVIEAELIAWLAEHEPADAEVVEGGEVEPAPAPAEPEEPKVEPEVEVEGQSFEEVEAENESPQERYERDEAWRSLVDRLLHRRADLEIAQEDGDLSEQHASDVSAEIDHLDSELEKLGAPRGWMPASIGQASLEV